MQELVCLIIFMLLLFVWKKGGMTVRVNDKLYNIEIFANELQTKESE